MRYYLGVDPGPSTGIALLRIDRTQARKQGEWQWSAFQCNGEAADYLISVLVRDSSPLVTAIEKFIVTNRGGTTGADADLTRRIVLQAENRAVGAVRVRPASTAKEWGTDKRLEKSGFPLGAKFKDARDAARHALYAAVWDGKERDPLR